MRRAFMIGIALLLSTVSSLSALAQPNPGMIARFDAGGLDLAEGVAVSSSGHIAVTGVASRSQGDDFVTALFDPNGELLWAQRIDEGAKDRGAGVGFDAAGNVYAVGTVRGSSDDVLLVKYSPTGDETWAVRFDKGTSETARALVMDPSGNVVVAGASFSANGGDGFVAKFAPDGRELWSRPANVYWLDEFFAVAVDGQGNIITSGRVADRGNFDAVVRKFSPSGDTMWTQYVKGPGNEEGRGVSVDGAGNVYLTGTLTRANEDGGLEKDLLIVKLDANGKQLWRRDVDLGDDDEGRGSATDSGGNVVVTGFTRIHGNKDPFVAKFDASGETLWMQTTPGIGIDGAGSIALTRDMKQIVVAGATQREGSDFDYLIISYDQGRPGASFSVLTQKPATGAAVAFEDTSVPDLAPLASRTWRFGDGAVSSETSPRHTYAKAGSYVVTLEVRDAWGNVATATKEVRIAAGADATPTTPSGSSGSGGPGSVPGALGESPERPGDGRGEPGEVPEKPRRGIPIHGAALGILALAAVAGAIRRRGA